MFSENEEQTAENDYSLCKVRVQTYSGVQTYLVFHANQMTIT